MTLFKNTIQKMQFKYDIGKTTHQILQFRCHNVKKTPNRKIKPGDTVNVEVLVIHSITKDVLIALKRRKKKLEKQYTEVR